MTDKLHDCEYNTGVACDPKTKDCSKCGWNPAVAKARLDKFCHAQGRCCQRLVVRNHVSSNR